MIASLFDMRCLFLFIALVQSVSLYKIYPGENEHQDLSSLTFNERLHQAVQNMHTGYEDIYVNPNEHVNKDFDEELQDKSKRLVASNRRLPMPQRRNNRPHWNPLIAAYKRCGELVSQENRENCFKDAVQMLFVHKL